MKLSFNQKHEIYCAALQANISKHTSPAEAAYTALRITHEAVLQIEKNGYDKQPEKPEPNGY
jgi:hypothetical protein